MFKFTLAEGTSVEHSSRYTSDILLYIELTLK